MKLTIDDEMVKRAEVAHYDAQCRGSGSTAAMRAALGDALNPPPEAEIKVTLKMCIAGQALALEARNQGACGDTELWVLVKDIYRAMRKLEPKADMIRAIKEGK
jgi:hypothetical protein